MISTGSSRVISDWSEFVGDALGVFKIGFWVSVGFGSKSAWIKVSDGVEASFSTK